MAKLIYSALTSLDGYVADERATSTGPSRTRRCTLVNDLERPIGTYLYGRRMYEVMSFWQTADASPTSRPLRDFAAIWQAADKIVFSRTLEDASTPKTRIEQAFDPEAVRELKASADSDLSIGGPGLAAQAIRAGLVDEYRLFVSPVVVGSGNPSLPDDVRIALELLDERRFGNGVVYLRYAPDLNQLAVNLLSPTPLWRFAGHMSELDIRVGLATDQDRFLHTDETVWFQEVSSAPTSEQLRRGPAAAPLRRGGRRRRPWHLPRDLRRPPDDAVHSRP